MCVMWEGASQLLKQLSILLDQYCIVIHVQSFKVLGVTSVQLDATEFADAPTPG